MDFGTGNCAEMEKGKRGGERGGNGHTGNPPPHFLPWHEAMCYDDDTGTSIGDNTRCIIDISRRGNRMTVKFCEM